MSISILPFDDDDLVREGISMAAADRVAAQLRILNDLCVSLRGNYVVGREEWNAAFEEIQELHKSLTPPLEWAQCIVDVEDEQAAGGES